MRVSQGSRSSGNALLDLVEASKAADGVEVVRSAGQVLLEELIEAQATPLIGPARRQDLANVIERQAWCETPKINCLKHRCNMFQQDDFEPFRRASQA